MGLPFLPRILVVADQFLLLGIHREDRLTTPLERLHLPVDVFKLGIAIGVILAFLGLAVGLQAVTQVGEEAGYRLMTDVVAETPQSLGQVARTLEAGRVRFC